MVAQARRVATRVLERIVRDEAWASPTLDAELGRSSSTRADAALATQIVYGTLRVKPDLDALLAQQAHRPIRVDPWTSAAMLAAAYQLMHLHKAPAHAVVHDAVEIVREKRGTRMAGFVNALLRRLAAQRPAAAQIPSSVVVPLWLDEALRASIGDDRCKALLHMGEEPPSIDLRVRGGVDRDAVAESILAAHRDAVVSPTSLSPVGLRLSGAGDPRRLPGYAQGDFAVQEEGAQLIGLLLGAQPAERVLDACAGRGGKTAQLLEAVGDAGSVMATDLHEHRLAQIEPELARLRLSAANAQTACVDWTVGPGAVRGQFDRVLVDAPCTGLGTLRRRPEILLRATPEDAALMGERQRRILENVSRRVKPGGTLLYAVCSPLLGEGPGMLGHAELGGFELQANRPSNLKSFEFDSAGRLLLGPWEPGAGAWADAYQIFMWVNVG